MVLRQGGFTLIELIIVIVLLGIVGVSTFSFLGFGTRIYTDSISRDEQVGTGRFVLERLTRELEGAYPGSIRISADQRCIEYVPVVAGSLYTQIPRPGSVVPFQAVTPFEYSFVVEQKQKIAVYALSEAQIYGSTNRIKALDSITADTPVAGFTQFNLATDDGPTFQRESPAKRFYVLAQPVSWCVTPGQQLRRYWNYDWQTTQPDLTILPLTGNTAVLATNIANDLAEPNQQLFHLAATDIRKRTVEVVLLVGSDITTETLTMHHGVTIANLP